jgi:ABC-2 type transport system permease protein
MSVFLAQLKAELRMTLTRGESLLLTLGIPLAVLVFFSLVKVIDTGTAEPVDFLAPSTIALAVISMAMTGVAIATAFEREYGVLKRLGTTPLGRPRLLGAKIASIICVQIIQVTVLTIVAVLLGWRPPASGWPMAIGALFLGTVAFAGLGLLMAGTLKATVTLAAANGLYIMLLLISGIVVPLSRFPTAMRAVVRLLPSTALAELIRDAFGGDTAPGQAWVVLVVWGVVAVGAAVKWFRWE